MHRIGEPLLRTVQRGLLAVTMMGAYIFRPNPNTHTHTLDPGTWKGENLFVSLEREKKVSLLQPGMFPCAIVHHHTLLSTSNPGRAWVKFYCPDKVAVVVVHGTSGLLCCVVMGSMILFCPMLWRCFMFSSHVVGGPLMATDRRWLKWLVMLFPTFFWEGTFFWTEWPSRF